MSFYTKITDRSIDFEKEDLDRNELLSFCHMTACDNEKLSATIFTGDGKAVGLNIDELRALHTAIGDTIERIDAQ